MSEEGKSRGVVFPGDQHPSAPPQHPPPYYYGTFQGVANHHHHQPYPPPPTHQPSVGFPQPTPPHNVRNNPPYYIHGYQTVPGIVIAPPTPVIVDRGPLPCCGCGIGWFLFVVGFFFGAIPWYVGAFILLFVRVDYREKAGLVACTIAAILALIAVGLGVQGVKYGCPITRVLLLLASRLTYIPIETLDYFFSASSTPPQAAVPLKTDREFHQFQVVGRGLPTEADEQPKIYRMKLWATNEVRAKSKFWYFLRKLKKVKKSNGQMLAINEIFEKNPTTIKNYGIWLRYQSRTGYHNMYKEYRDTTLNGGIEQMYTEMASRHRVRHHCIQVIKTATIPAKLCKRESTKQFHNSKIKFPLVFKKVRPPTRKLKTTYKASRPNLFV
ncbi:hypothetical protein SSX86_015739 [Deinandra increscens subsp. villosa]|uniref:Large ribosomal subunit protein eL20 domain-containing protein n=1 Tax=Deinandra increscens subsp. villosa TaxID=3103831 RepID=A0AAP0D1F2_9ASTR